MDAATGNVPVTVAAVSRRHASWPGTAARAWPERSEPAHPEAVPELPARNAGRTAHRRSDAASACLRNLRPSVRAHRRACTRAPQTRTAATAARTWPAALGAGANAGKCAVAVSYVHDRPLCAAMIDRHQPISVFSALARPRPSAPWPPWPCTRPASSPATSAGTRPCSRSSHRRAPRGPRPASRSS